MKLLLLPFFLVLSVNAMDKVPLCPELLRLEIERLTANQCVLDELDRVRKCDLCPKPAILFIYACEDICSYCTEHKPRERKPDDESEQHIR